MKNIQLSLWAIALQLITQTTNSLTAENQDMLQGDFSPSMTTLPK